MLNYTLTRKSQSWLWWLAPSAGTTIGNTIYFPDRWFSLSEPERTAWLRHEEMHVEQRIDWLRYLTSAAYRRAVEEPAYERQIRYLVAHGRSINVESWVGVMSEGYNILQWITRDEAVEILKKWLN